MKSLEFLIFDPRTLPEEGIEIRGTVSFAELDIPETDRLEAAEPVSLTISVKHVQSGVLVQGSAHTVLRARCDRCLTYFDRDLKVKDICHYFKTAEVENIDLTDDIRQDILLSLPQQQVVCGQKCKGLCPLCGCNLNVRDCGCDLTIKPESVWDTLDQLDLPAGKNDNRNED